MKRRFFARSRSLASSSNMKTADLCREHSISQNTFNTWRSKFGGMSVSEAQKIRQVEAENAKLKHLVANLSLDHVALKDLLSKNW